MHAPYMLDIPDEFHASPSALLLASLRVVGFNPESTDRKSMCEGSDCFLLLLRVSAWRLGLMPRKTCVFVFENRRRPALSFVFGVREYPGCSLCWLQCSRTRFLRRFLADRIHICLLKIRLFCLDHKREFLKEEKAVLQRRRPS